MPRPEPRTPSTDGGASTRAERTGRRTAGLGGLRGRLLDEVRAAAKPVGIDDLAERCGVHRNTVRGHLEALESEGLVESGSRPTGGKGRPRQVFVATAAGVGEGDRNHLLLAQILADQLTRSTDRPEEAARRAARGWGRAIAASHHRRRDSERPVGSHRVLHDALDAIGFEPDRRITSRTREFVLLNCPFREALDGYQDVVCAVHLGLMEGLLGMTETASDDGVVLEPFAARHGCLARIAHR